MSTNETSRCASALAGFAAAVCSSFVWLGTGLAILVTNGGVA